jgi:hydrogenase maturation factor
VTDAASHCITCGDDARPVRVLRADSATELALCAGPGGERHEVDTGLVGEVAPGEALLVHAGVALARLDTAPGGPER